MARRILIKIFSGTADNCGAFLRNRKFPVTQKAAEKTQRNCNGFVNKNHQEFQELYDNLFMNI